MGAIGKVADRNIQRLGFAHVFEIAVGQFLNSWRESWGNIVGCSQLRRIHKTIFAIIVYMEEGYRWEIGQTGQPCLGTSMDEEVRSDLI